MATDCPSQHVRDRTLSKFCAYALRHAPDAFDLAPDADAAVPLATLLDVLSRAKRFHWVDDAALRGMVARSDKQRYELLDESDDATAAPTRIRARYGHSFMTVSYTPATPPQDLWHGTGTEAVDAILRDGLKPMSRKYVHLTDDVEIAEIVGSRHPGKLALLRIDAAAATEAGIEFFAPGPRVYLAREIPPEFLAVDHKGGD